MALLPSGLRAFARYWESVFNERCGRSVVIPGAGSWSSCAALANRARRTVLSVKSLMRWRASFGGLKVTVTRAGHDLAEQLKTSMFLSRPVGVPSS